VRSARHVCLAALLCGFSLAVAGTGAAATASEEFVCVMTASAGQSDPETISISLDAAARTAKVATAAGTYAFQQLAVSSIAVSGIAGVVSFGLDRSTSRVVWQRYDDNKPVIRYGECRKGQPAAGGEGAVTAAGAGRSAP